MMRDKWLKGMGAGIVKVVEEKPVEKESDVQDGKKMLIL